MGQGGGKGGKGREREGKEGELSREEGRGGEGVQGGLEEKRVDGREVREFVHCPRKKRKVGASDY